MAKLLLRKAATVAGDKFLWRSVDFWLENYLIDGASDDFRILKHCDYMQGRFL